MAFSTDIMGGCDGLFICMALWANSVTEGLFWTLITIGIGVVLFMATYRFGNNRAFGFASFISGMAALTCAFLGLMQWRVTSIFIAMLVVGLVVMQMQEK